MKKVMKYVFQLFVALSLIGCATNVNTVKRDVSELNEIYGNHKKEYRVYCSCKSRARTVQRRISRNCSSPAREGLTLILKLEHINCTHKFLKNTYGFLNDDERAQIYKHHKK